MDGLGQNSQYRVYSIKLWPPSQNTRHMLVQRIANNLMYKSIFTHKFGTLDGEEAIEKAKGIEDEAFTTASLHYEYNPDGDGCYAIQLYVKYCSKLLLEVLKSLPMGKHESAFDTSRTKSHRSLVDNDPDEGGDDENDFEGEARETEMESKMRNLGIS